MNVRGGRLICIGAGIALSAAVIAGCTAVDDGAASEPTGSSSAPASPSPSPTLGEPEAPVEGEVASSVVDTSATPSSASSVAGPGLLAGDRPFYVEGECLGTRGEFRLTTADPEDAGRTLVAGTIDCSAPMKSEFGYAVGYDGPVQLAFTDTDGIERAWLRVVQP